MQTAASGGLHRFVLVRGRAMQRDVARYERSEKCTSPIFTCMGELLVASPEIHFITSSLQNMNVEEGHELGVRHVGGLGHVAPI
jgi:hypothetical protein